MRITVVFLGLMLVTLAETLPHNVHSRQKRGFRANSVDRVAHGYGKRAESDRKHLYLSDLSDTLTVEDLTQLIVENPSLAFALVKTFVDTNDDGYISNSEIYNRLDQ
ncbi:uncharacterized protein LOC121387385 [Gigantopelta aegis]|uniref:uncharacterized protein LOC121387385 n=1 Tax=Gigantopelta aegis TaxID=1735272 RepID=UPI001B888205|nr:uncharacterized protein LOC121387385 [Gigantopelta aegis]